MPMTAAYAPALTHGFEGFLDFLRDQEAGPAVLSPKRFSDVLSIDLQTLAGQAHVHRNTLSRAPASESVQRFMREALRVLRYYSVHRALVRAKGHGIILAPFLKAEAAPEWEGNYEFIEAESKGRHPHRVEREVLRRYLAAYRRHFELWKTLCRKYDVVLSRVPCEPGFQTAMQFEAISSGALEIWG